MTDSSSDEEKLSADEREQIYQETGVDEEAGLKALLTDVSKYTLLFLQVLVINLTSNSWGCFCSSEGITMPNYFV